MSELDLPMFSQTPYPVLANSNLNDSERLQFGIIVGLCHKEGYCWATDEQLAEQRSVGLRTMQRWLENLEKEGCIKRVTENKSYRNEEGKLRWFKARKIYVDLGFQKKFAEPPKMAGSTEPAKNGGIVGTRQKWRDTNIEPPTEKTTTKKRERLRPPDKKPPDKVVVVSCLSDLDLSEQLKKKLSKRYQEEELKLAVKRTQAWHDRRSDEAAIQHVLKHKDTWKDKRNEADLETVHKAATTKAFGAEIIEHETKIEGLNRPLKNSLRLCKDYVECECEGVAKCFYYKKKSFMDELKEYLIKIRAFKIADRLSCVS